MPRRRRAEEHEEHENHERWLVTYADMVTLLMVLFIVMFAMSQVDERKFNALKEGLAAGFGSSTAVVDGSSSLLDHPGSSPMDPVVRAQFVGRLDPRQRSAVEAALAEERRLEEERARADAQAEADRLLRLWRRLQRAVRAEGLEGDVTAEIDDRGLVVSLVSRHVVFEPDLATLSARGQRVVDTLTPVLRRIPDPLQVDGHTNQVPVQPAHYATDWDLSAARAVTVLRRLHEVGRIPGQRLSASAFGHQKPLVDPERPGSQAVNKRVDIVVLSPLASESRALLPEVAPAALRAATSPVTDRDDRGGDQP